MTDLGKVKSRAQTLLAQDGSLDAREVTAIIASVAAALRRQTGQGMVLLIDELGRFIEHGRSAPRIRPFSRCSRSARVAARVPTWRSLAFCTIGCRLRLGTGRLDRSGMDALCGALRGTLVRELDGTVDVHVVARPAPPSSAFGTVSKQSEQIYDQAVELGLFSAERDDVVAAAPNLYPLHPSAVATLACGMLRFGQNERSLFGFLQSLEPAGFKRFAHATCYGPDQWYRTPMAFDHLAAMIGHMPTATAHIDGPWHVMLSPARRISRKDIGMPEDGCTPGPSWAHPGSGRQTLAPSAWPWGSPKLRPSKYWGDL